MSTSNFKPKINIFIKESRFCNSYHSLYEYFDCTSWVQIMDYNIICWDLVLQGFVHSFRNTDFFLKLFKEVPQGIWCRLLQNVFPYLQSYRVILQS